MKQNITLKILVWLHFTVQAMENLPNDIFFNYIVSYIISPGNLYEEQMEKWSEISKNYTQKECYEIGPKYLNDYINTIDDLSSHSWFCNYLSKDLLSLSLVNRTFYFRIYNRYKETVESYRKRQICLCLEELQVSHRQHGVIQPAFGRFFEYAIAKKLCKRKCSFIKDDIMIEYYLAYGYDQKKDAFNIRMVLGFTFGHGKCQENEFFTDQEKEGYTFSCKKFGNFLYDAAYYGIEDDYMRKILFSLAFYIEQQPNLLFKVSTYRTFDDRVKLFNYVKYDSANHNDENRVIIGRHYTHTGARFIILPFNVSLENKNVLKFFQLLPMYYTWDMENNQTHRILKIFPEPYPEKEKNNENLKFELKLSDRIVFDPEIVPHQNTPNLNIEPHLTTQPKNLYKHLISTIILIMCLRFFIANIPHLNHN
ncbi:MAG TPA: hypothetical protein VL201_05605 [Patescibacteria group bacterium]|nr:hypothetical protein [Patescibacteria group bacterium]